MSPKVKSSQRRRSRRRSRRPSFEFPWKKAIIIGIVSMLAIYLIYTLSFLGPKKVDYESLAFSDNTVLVNEEWQERGIALYRRYRERIADGSNPLVEEDMLVLQEARDLLRKFIAANPNFSLGEDKEILAEMDGLYDDFFALPLLEASKELVFDAATAERNQDFDLALSLMQEAFAKQETIHHQYGDSQHVSFARLSTLDNEVSRLEAKPIFVRSEQLEAQARQMMKENKWEEALPLMEEAKELQLTLNRQYRDSIFVRIRRETELEALIQEIRSGELKREIEQLLSDVATLQEEGNFDGIASCYADATLVQKRLNEEFPQSPFASGEQVLLLEQKRQTALSTPDYDQIVRGNALLDRLLRVDRITDAIIYLETLSQQIIDFNQNYPDSDYETDRFLQKANYLQRMKGYISEVKQVYVQGKVAVDLGQADGVFASEVSQNLYAMVMGNNPSRQKGEDLPVDAVTFGEAIRFCERLSWLCGEQIRLPLVKEVELLLAGWQEDAVQASAWFGTNARGKTQTVASSEAMGAGVYDLLGNVEEWVVLDEKSAVLLGSVSGEFADFWPWRVEEKPSLERNRFRGFRFVYQEVKG